MASWRVFEGERDMRRKFMRELAALGLPQRPASGISLAPIADADLESLPEAACRYLRFMRVVGRPRDWSFRVRATGRFRRSAVDAWMACEAWQYNTRLALARVFYMRLRFFGVVPVLGRDTYVGGRGRMLIRPLDMVTVGDGTGEAYDIGELVTYLNDGIMIAPSMLLVPDVAWSAAGPDCFDVSLSDRGRTVKARVFIDGQGAPLNFETTDRFYSDPKNATKVSRCRWTTPIDGTQEAGDRRLAARGRATWHPPEGDLTYAELAFDPASLAFNVAPGE
jgi:hypothetical protein